ncbi:MAG: UDP-glucose/GDP-mannose dehydrogenase family protein [Thermogemmatispora sp.]|jgi:UDPglucose 6-dehydrogenase|uniref:UDP-glucose 6-dehydrogenase n=1 Tax=Thermogemmatispora aurantia TaxID=2045279 RepID=A0A5J4KES7_9CHLR|nr:MULTISPECIES: UDP-glucose/GDP-mannose dehydrogenase family protein [Thermogemmatispora]MBE3566678.1 UDP-glucose/GDP-mannose dehydrogenase family protein [Thermogemmatispora sp.]GER84891.1 UDP-glucose 6-dehydrogenase [Thermogemmatispora aurantia]
MSKICVIGTGYVGLVTGTCFADMGNDVTCVDIVEEKIARLKRGEVPIYEPGLAEMIARNVRAGRLHFTTSYREGLADSEFIFIAVNTPTGSTQGSADMRYVEMAARMIAEELDHYAVIINKSTVPVGSGDVVTRIIRTHLARPDVSFAVVSNPEFLREGAAIQDFLNPDRVVLGSSDMEAAHRVAALYLPLRAPIIMTDIYTAEMIKYASNAFLATKISFINEIAQICERLGADVKEVAVGMGYDKRIGRAFLDAGLGYGGSCFPKDVRALAHMADEAGLHPQLLHAVMEINQDQRRLVVDKLVSILGSLRNATIGILGLAFKANTDDMREAPSLDIIRWVTGQGALVRAYDPVARETARQAMEREGIRLDLVTFCSNAYEVAEQADAIIIVTDWNEFKSLDMVQIRNLMRRPVLIDGRNIYEPREMVSLGFTYRGIGRGTGPAATVLPASDSTTLPPAPTCERTLIGEGDEYR